MPTDAGLNGVLTIRRALKLTVEDNTRASAVLEALRHLAPHAVTLDEGDTLVELQVAALAVLGTPARDPARGDALQHFRAVWLAFDAAWTVQAKSVGSATLHRPGPGGQP